MSDNPKKNPQSAEPKYERVSSGAPWEAIIGYSRAVRIGPYIHVSGTTGTGPDGRITAPDDPAEQTRQTLRTIFAALEQFGAGPADIVRTRVYITRQEDWEAVGRAHGESFGALRPASSLIVVAALIDPDMRVEIEADAYVGA